MGAILSSLEREVDEQNGESTDPYADLESDSDYMTDGEMSVFSPSLSASAGDTLIMITLVDLNGSIPESEIMTLSTNHIPAEKSM